MKKSLILAVLTSVFSIASVSAGGFSWGISFGFGGGFCAPVYHPPVVCVPTPVVYTTPVIYSQPIVQQVVYTSPVVQQVVVSQPAVVVQPIIPVVNYYRPDCYRSPVTGTVWVGGASGGHHHRKHR